MSVEQAQRTVNQIDKDIADLEKKMADLVKKEAEKTKKVGDIQRSIIKNTSQSTLQSKTRQIESCQKDLSRILSDKATINQKLADKRKQGNQPRMGWLTVSAAWTPHRRCSRPLPIISAHSVRKIRFIAQPQKRKTTCPPFATPGPRPCKTYHHT